MDTVLFQTRYVSHLPQSRLLRPARRLSPIRPSSSFLGTRFRFVNTKTHEIRGSEALVVEATTTGAGTVRIIVQGRKLEITDSIRNYVEKKVGHALDHYAHSIKTAEVTLSVRGGDTGTKGNKEQKTEVTIRTLRSGVVRSEETAESLYASIDLVCDKIERKMQKVKELAILKGKWPGRGGPKGGEKISEFLEPEMESFDSDQEVFEEPSIVRTKLFNLEAMDPLDAVEKLENLGHDFYVFKNKDDGAVNVLYKRKSYGYGLIIPAEENS